MKIGLLLFSAAFFGLALWRLVRIRSFVREDVEWLREHFEPADDDELTAWRHSMSVAALFATLSLGCLWLSLLWVEVA